jgi:RHS repeat-associated protein
VEGEVAHPPGLSSDISSGGELISQTRRYHPTQGRWISPDSVIPNTYNPQSLNGYHYSLNQPTNTTDPSGNCTGDDPTCGLDIGGGQLFNIPDNATINYWGSNVGDAGSSCGLFFGYCANYNKNTNTLYPFRPGQLSTYLFDDPPISMPMYTTPHGDFSGPLDPFFAPPAPEITTYPRDSGYKELDRGLTAINLANTLGTAFMLGVGGSQDLEGPSGLTPAHPFDFPANNGFLSTAVDETLKKGMFVDRYGEEVGKYVSPMGTPAEMRALPPGSLSKPYNVYMVAKPIRVKAGLISPAYGQSGLGTQYLLESSVGELVRSGALVRLR